MGQKNRRWIAAALTVLTAFSAVFSLPQGVSAEEPEHTNPVEQTASTAADEGGGPVLLEGISLDRTVLLMETGGKASLTASLIPEDTTEDLEILWESDDPEVAQVSGEGLSATVTAPEGEGGAAVITVSAGGFSARCRVLVTVREPMLESLFCTQNSSGSMRYELTEGEPGSNEYTLRIPENTNVLYVRPQLRDDVDAVITAHFTDVNTGEEKAVELPVDESTSLTSSANGRIILAYDTEPRELILEVASEERTETYQIHIVRGTYLGGFTLEDRTGKAVSYSPSFAKNQYEYEAHVPSSMKELQISLEAGESSSTLLTVNGEQAENGTYSLSLDQWENTAVLCAGDGQSVPYEYRLTVYVDEVCRLSVSVEPEEGVFAIYDEDKIRLEPVDGVYELIKGAKYSYTVSAFGYRPQNGDISLMEDESRSFTLERVGSDNLPELSSEWGGFWKTEDNQNITSAGMPVSLDNAEIYWRKQYGKSGNDNDSVSEGILVENYLCCFQGKTLMYLDRNTGEIVSGVTMDDTGNSAFAKPLYAAGMIFVPLNNGRVQAFRADTLESLWVYVDPVGGSAVSALRYDSGYLYAGFTDGNLVCISVTDEDQENSKETKAAVWRKYDGNGFYHTGFYTGEKYIYAGSRSGILYCLDKRTGAAAREIALPGEAGAISTAVCHAGGRLYFATENGYLYTVILNGDGLPDAGSLHSLKLGGYICGTPLVYQGRIYVGSATRDRYGVIQAPYYMNVVAVGADGSFSLAYRMEVSYGPEQAPTLSTAYEEETGYVYVYFTTDSPEGNVYLLKDRQGALEPGEGSGLLYRQDLVNGAGSGGVTAGDDGSLYIRYESGWLYAIRPTGLYLEGIEATGDNVVVDGGSSFDSQAVSHTVVLTSESDQITLTLKANEGTAIFMNGREGAVQTVTLQDGIAEVTVVLKQGEQSREYQLTVRRRYSDASLEKLDVSYDRLPDVLAMEVKPAFDKEHTDYESSMFGYVVQPYYVWPKLPDGAESSMKVTVVSGVSGMKAGAELTPSTIYLDEGVRLRYTVAPESSGPAVIAVTVTAEDGVTVREYRLSLFLNNEIPVVTAGQNAVVERQETSVAVRVNASIDGYVYYIFRKDGDTQGMPSSSEIRKLGQRTAVTAGDNLLELSGAPPGKGALYLYEMSYSQRWSTGILVDIPAWDGKEDPDPEPPEGLGDINGDGSVNVLDVIMLANRIAGGTQANPETEDINGDGLVNVLDVINLANQISAGE